MGYLLGRILIISSVLKLSDWKLFRRIENHFQPLHRHYSHASLFFNLSALIFGFLLFLFPISVVPAFIIIMLYGYKLVILIIRQKSERSWLFSAHSSLLPISYGAVAMAEEVIIVGLSLFLIIG